MDDTDFSEDTTCKQQEDLPYDEDLSQMKTCNDYNLTSRNGFLDVSGQVMLTGNDLHGKTAQNDTCPSPAMALTWDKIIENTVNKKRDREKWFSRTHFPANKGDSSKSNISDILLHHLSAQQFFRGQGIDCRTLPEASAADSVDEAAVIKNIISHYVKNSWPKESTPEFREQPNPKGDGEDSNNPSCSSSMVAGNTSGLEEPVATRESGHQVNFNFLTTIKGPSDKEKGCLGQAPLKQLPEKASSSNGFKNDQGQVQSQHLDFCKVTPRVKIPKNAVINKPLLIAKQASFSPKLRNQSMIGQDILDTMSRSKCVEKQHLEQKRKMTESSQQIQPQPIRSCSAVESETSFLKLTSISWKDLPSSSSSIFQKIFQGKQMCQKLKEQTDQLKTKVQEFSKRIKQDSLCHLQDRSMVLERLQGHLEVLEQDFVPTREKHLALKQQVLKHESPALGNFDPEREIFRLEMLLEGIKEKTEESRCTSVLSPPMNPLVIPDDFCATHHTHSLELFGLDVCQEVIHTVEKRVLGTVMHTVCTGRRTVLGPYGILFVFFRKQNMEEKDHRRNCGRFLSVIHKKGLYQDSSPGKLRTMGSHFCSDSGTGLQNNKCEDCSTQIHNSQRACSGEPLKEFHYRYNTPGQYYLNHSGRGASVQPPSLDESKNSSPRNLFKPKRICPQRVNSKRFQDKCEPMPQKKNPKTFMTFSSALAIPSTHLHSCRISGSKSLCDFNSTKETESKMLNSALDQALKTATILKKSTDQMIKAIAEDLAKAQRLRNGLKF
uniref:Protein AKNAD1 n=1 Tax=Castor canadensis TaxID=51338 RepID=A0A8B7UCI2_CASCN|nr:protein AKNAD1 [Castor canadensis]